MSPFVWGLIAVIALSVWLRMRGTYRKARKGDAGKRIQRELERLRKKRDED